MKKIEKLESGRLRVYTVNSQPSRTDQQWKDEVDVNNILKKFTKTGTVTHVAKIQGQFADVSAVPDFHTAMTTVKEAEREFLHMPSHIRKRFGNDLTQMVDFMNDEKNREEAIKLGLIEKPVQRDDTPLANPTPVVPKTEGVTDDGKTAKDS